MKQYGQQKVCYGGKWNLRNFIENKNLECVLGCECMRPYRGMSAHEWYGRQLNAAIPARFHCRG
jgi:hypothetical protein